MATANSVMLARLNASPQGNYQIGSATESPIIWLRYRGTTDSGATVAVAAGGDMAFTTDGTTADTTVSTDGTIDLSTPAAGENTLGEVVTVINASANWQAYLLGRPEDSSDNTVAVFTETDISTVAYKATGLYLYADGAVGFYMSYSISGFDPSKSTTTHWDDDGCYSCVQQINVTNNRSALNYIQVYSCGQTASTLLWQDALADNTATQYGSNSNKLPPFQSRIGERILVKSLNDQTTTGDTFQVKGYTIDTRNRRFVHGYTVTNRLL